MTTPSRQNRPVSGIVYGASATFMLTLQDAAIKWFVDEVSVFQVLFLRSITIIAIVLMIYLPRRGVSLFRTTRPMMNLVRVICHFLAFTLFFSAIKLMALADVITLMLTSGLFMAILSGPTLGEPTGKREWIAVLTGFVGVIMVAGPGGSGMSFTAVAIVLAASVAYAMMTITTRLLSDTEPPERLIVFSACGIVLTSGLMMPWFWQSTDATTIALMLLLGLLSTAGHWMLVQAYSLAPVHIVAPFEYTALVWGIILGIIFWDEIPSTGMLWGSAFIIASGLIVVYGHRRVSSA